MGAGEAEVVEVVGGAVGDTDGMINMAGAPVYAPIAVRASPPITERDVVLVRWSK